MDHEIKLTDLAEIGRVKVTKLPTAMAIMALSGEREPTYFDVLLAQDLRNKLREAGLRALCKGNVPTRTGTSSTSRATSDADVFVEALNRYGDES